jgi:hypothetical protein
MAIKIKSNIVFHTLLIFAFSLGLLIAGCGDQKEEPAPQAEKKEERKLPDIVITEPRFTELGTTSDPKIKLAGLSVKQLESVTWENSRGGSGVAEGTINWRVPEVVLQPGENIITISAKDSNTGEIYTAEVKVIYKPVDLLGTLAVMPQTIYIDDKNEMTVEIQVNPHPNLNKSKVEVYRTYEDGKNMYLLGLLADDGKSNNGDKVAGDNIWSCKFILSKGKEGEVQLKRVGQTADELSQLWGLFEKDVGKNISIRVSAYLLEDDGTFTTIYSNTALVGVNRRE